MRETASLSSKAPGPMEDDKPGQPGGAFPQLPWGVWGLPGLLDHITIS